MNPAAVVSLLPLLPRRLESLSLTELAKIKKTLGFDGLEVTEELKSAALALFQGKDIDTVSDIVQSPESIQQLVSFFQKRKEKIEPDNEMVWQCKHCLNLSTIKLN